MLSRADDTGGVPLLESRFAIGTPRYDTATGGWGGEARRSPSYFHSRLLIMNGNKRSPPPPPPNRYCTLHPCGTHHVTRACDCVGTGSLDVGPWGYRASEPTPQHAPPLCLHLTSILASSGSTRPPPRQRRSVRPRSLPAPPALRIAGSRGGDSRGLIPARSRGTWRRRGAGPTRGARPRSPHGTTTCAALSAASAAARSPSSRPSC